MPTKIEIGPICLGQRPGLIVANHGLSNEDNSSAKRMNAQGQIIMIANDETLIEAAEGPQSADICEEDMKFHVITVRREMFEGEIVRIVPFKTMLGAVRQTTLKYMNVDSPPGMMNIVARAISTVDSEQCQWRRQRRTAF